MTALVSLESRLRVSKVAVVLPPHTTGAEAIEFATHGADLLVFSLGDRDHEDVAKEVRIARNGLFGRATLVAVDRLDLALEVGADLVFLKRPGWRPFGYPRPHRYTIFGRSISGPDEAGSLAGDPFQFAFVGTAIGSGKVSNIISEMALRYRPLGLPAAPVWFAAGGISSGTIEDVLAAGARRVAVSNAIFEASDPLQETARLAEAVAAAWDNDADTRAYVADSFAG